MQAPSPPPASVSRSRNDLFQASWTPDPPPPPLTPPRTPARTPPLSIPRRAPVRKITTRLHEKIELPPAFGGFGCPPPPVFTFGPPPSMADALPAPAFHTSPSDSKTSSFFASAADHVPPPAPRLRDMSTSPSANTSLSRKASVRSARSAHHPDSPQAQLSPPQLTPLHQSPSLAPTVWTPPHPPTAEDVALRYFPEPQFLLGEGRFASVFLAAQKREKLDAEWSLCAAKRLAPDRESQTMGLREAFFLNRLTAPREASKEPAAVGQMYIVKLIAVKEIDAAPSGHARTASEQVDGPRRQRSSTIYAGGRQDPGSHPNLPALLDQTASPAASRLVLVLEHCPLGTLDRLLRSSPGLVGADLWGRWAREAAEALAWVHACGIVHLDIKPSNLLLTTDLHLRVSDFGSSLLIHPDHPPTDGVGLGTLPFSAPELVDNTAPFGFPVDIFALGATLYQCLTGREPYRGMRPVEMMHHVRRGNLWDWLERERLARIGAEESAPASPYPSAWRAEPPVEPAIKRGGSLRVPLKHSPLRGPGDHTPSPLVVRKAERVAETDAEPQVEPGPEAVEEIVPERPQLARVGSAESIQASADVEVGYGAHASPAGVRLWAAWQRGAHNAIERLLDTTEMKEDAEGSDDVEGESRSSRSPMPAQRSPSSPASPYSSTGRRDRSPQQQLQPHTPAYDDGAPAMLFLGGGRVPAAVREVLRGMLEPDEEERMTAEELVGAWARLGVGKE